MSSRQKPGQNADRSGQVEIVGPRGGHTGKERAAIKGKSLLPAPKPGQHYIMVDPSKNGAGQKRLWMLSESAPSKLLRSALSLRTFQAPT